MRSIPQIIEFMVSYLDLNTHYKYACEFGWKCKCCKIFWYAFEYWKLTICKWWGCDKYWFFLHWARWINFHHLFRNIKHFKENQRMVTGARYFVLLKRLGFAINEKIFDMFDTYQRNLSVCKFCYRSSQNHQIFCWILKFSKFTWVSLYICIS